MAITVTELEALDLGYLHGVDLMAFCPANLLISQYTVSNTSLQNGCTIAYDRIKSNLNSKYDMGELLKVGSARSALMVEITSILAIRSCLGNLANVSDYMLTLFKRVEKDVLDIRNGQLNLPLKEAPCVVYSYAKLISDSFSTLG